MENQFFFTIYKIIFLNVFSFAVLKNLPSDHIFDIDLSQVLKLKEKYANMLVQYFWFYL